MSSVLHDSKVNSLSTNNIFQILQQKFHYQIGPQEQGQRHTWGHSSQLTALSTVHDGLTPKSSSNGRTDLAEGTQQPARWQQSGSAQPNLLALPLQHKHRQSFSIVKTCCKCHQLKSFRLHSLGYYEKRLPEAAAGNTPWSPPLSGLAALARVLKSSPSYLSAAFPCKAGAPWHFWRKSVPSLGNWMHGQMHFHRQSHEEIRTARGDDFRRFKDQSLLEFPSNLGSRLRKMYSRKNRCVQSIFLCQFLKLLLVYLDSKCTHKVSY